VGGRAGFWSCGLGACGLRFGGGRAGAGRKAGREAAGAAAGGGGAERNRDPRGPGGRKKGFGRASRRRGWGSGVQHGSLGPKTPRPKCPRSLPGVDATPHLLCCGALLGWPIGFATHQTAAKATLPTPPPTRPGPQTPTHSTKPDPPPSPAHPSPPPTPPSDPNPLDSAPPPQTPTHPTHPHPNPNPRPQPEGLLRPLNKAPRRLPGPRLGRPPGPVSRPRHAPLRAPAACAAPQPRAALPAVRKVRGGARPGGAAVQGVAGLPRGGHAPGRPAGARRQGAGPAGSAGVAYGVGGPGGRFCQPGLARWPLGSGGLSGATPLQSPSFGAPLKEPKRL
jgi:hypothetical protein